MMNEKKTVIAGASSNPTRYAYQAAALLDKYGYPFVPVGRREGSVFNRKFLLLKDMPVIENVDTVTLYVSPKYQSMWAEFIQSLSPRRVLFNPGTENLTFQEQLTKKGIHVESSCTLVLLKTNQY